MTVNHPITVDLVQPGLTPRLYAMQHDANSRVIVFTLTQAGAPWEAPEGAVFGLSYRKSDGTRGYYTENIVPMDATVSASLAPQVLTCPGTVEAALICIDEEGRRIGAFPFEILVAADPAAGSTASEHYFPQGCAVLYTPQSLTPVQQTQAKANLGIRDAGTGEFLGWRLGELRFPRLPQWDQAAYPHAALVAPVSIAFAGKCWAYFYAFKTCEYTRTSDGYHAIQAWDVAMFTCNLDPETLEPVDDWKSSRSEKALIGAYAGCHLQWANFPVQAEDGGVFLEASEPEAVYAPGEDLLETLKAAGQIGYEERFTQELIPETQAEFVPAEELLGVAVAFLDIALKPRTAYTVYLDGAQYSGTADEDGAFLGNLHILGEGEDTGEPFLVVRGAVVIPEAGVHTVRILEHPVVRHTIAPKWLLPPTESKAILVDNPGSAYAVAQYAQGEYDFCAFAAAGILDFFATCMVTGYDAEKVRFQAVSVEADGTVSCYVSTPFRYDGSRNTYIRIHLEERKLYNYPI